ncbi:MAG: protein-disulfide reductase DsbD [Gammaproteobacteria bacterium]|nr:protein-disulfide reductase DsbD [Gammaproteobacteria bacterium]
MVRWFVGMLIYLMISVSLAGEMVKPLPGNSAFSVSSFTDKNNQLVIQWNIAPGYYLYRDRINIELLPSSQVKIGKVSLPAGHPKTDVIRGAYEAYSDQLTVPIAVSSRSEGILGFSISYQGCSSAGFCYPPMKKYFKVDVSRLVPSQGLTAYVSDEEAAVPENVESQQGYATELLLGHHLVWIVISFLFLGLLLAFTPCVLPMIPILSSIIVGYGRNISSRKAFSLSLSYVFGMAVAYAAAGIIVALVGSRIQVALQNPWVIVVFSGLFVLLALSLFGFYDVRLPNRVHQRVASWSRRHTGGTYVGVFFMGALSTLVVSPCVSAPLVGVLAYIGKSGDVVLGGLALMSLGVGMGIPLLLLGASAGKLLPKAGQWMDTVKQFFGLLMLGLAVWMLSRIFPGQIILFLWAVVALLTAFFVWRLQHSKKILHKLNQGLGLVILSYSFILILGSILGKTDPFYLLAERTIQLAETARPTFAIVKNMADLDQQLALAKANKKEVLLDFYADWCVSCVLMDRNVFGRPEVKEALAKFVLIRADVTENNAFDQALLKRYQIIAPPTIVFFDIDGNALSKQDIVGEVNSKEFLADINRVSYDQGVNDCKAGISAC